jgi:hypothetical protein
MNHMPLVVSIISLCSLSSRRYRLPPTFYIDNPEYGPGAIFGASSVYTSSASASSSSTSTPSAASTPTKTPKGNSSNAGPIAGGIIGGIATISIIVALILYLRRTRRRSQAAAAGVGASQPILNDGAVGKSPPGSPRTMRFYVRVFKCPTPLRLCVLMRHFLPISIHLGPK